MVKRLLLVALTAGALGAQFTADAFCASCQGGVCRISRKHATTKKAQPKKVVKRVAKKVRKVCRSCSGGVCRVSRKHVAKKAEKGTKPVVCSAKKAELCVLACLNNMEKEAHKLLPALKKTQYATYAPALESKMFELRLAKIQIQQGMNKSR